MADAERRPGLGAIRAVTYAVADLRSVEAAYVGELGYVVAARACVDAAQARAWDAPAAEGRRTLVLAPESGEAVHLRFVESPCAADWRALTTWGWNATEFVVRDVDALAARLQGGAFDIIGPPAPLTRFPMIRAMQAIGPAGECCYFTEVGPGSGLDLAAALAFVGRVFIVVAGGPDADALFAPYAAFANALDPPVATPVRVLSQAHGLPLETPHRHGLVRLPGGTLVELDAYPTSATARAKPEGELAPGMAMASFQVDRLVGHAFIAPLAPCGLPGAGGFAGCLHGAAGELIELVAPSSVPNRELRP